MSSLLPGVQQGGQLGCGCCSRAVLSQDEETLGVQGKQMCVRIEEEEVKEEEGREKIGREILKGGNLTHKHPWNKLNPKS